MNKERMLQLAAFIEELPAKRFDMNFWAVNKQDDIDPKALGIHKCGTSGCIAGWAVHLFADRTADNVDAALGSFGDEAQDLLDLNYEQRNSLFLANHWGEARWTIDAKDITREIAAAKIREMVASES